MIEKLIKSTIKKNNLLEKGDHVIVGLSGGPDSVCLFFALLGLQDEFDLRISAVHVNHMLRPGDADEDQAYVEGLCRSKGVRCRVSVIDCVRVAKERGMTTEEAGREIRYEAFFEAAKALIREGANPGSIKIAVAQNKNDQAETMLMRIIRGTGVNGLSGIGYKRMGEHGATVIRPLLDAGRADIEEYCRRIGAEPRMDLTNDEPMYTRNRIRLQLIPYLAENFNENIVGALARLAQSAKEDNEYLWERAREACAALSKGPGVLDREGLRKADSAIRHRAVMMAFQEVGLLQDISAAHLAAIDGIVMGGSATAEVDLPGGYAMAVSYGDATAFLKGAGSSKEQAGRPGFSMKADFDKARLCLIAEDYQDKIEIRGRRPGDLFAPKGMKAGRKKLQDYLVDRKIPKARRDGLMIAAIGSEVLWVLDPVPGGRSDVSEKYGATEETKEALTLEIGSGA